MKNIILLFFASALFFSCSNDSVDLLPDLSVVISSPDESTKSMGDTIGIYLGSDLATSINSPFLLISSNKIKSFLS